MSELMVLLQALLLIAGWLLFLRAQTELRAQAARQSLTGELEELRQTVDALLQKLVEEAAQAEARIEARLRELEQRSTDSPVRAEDTPRLDRTVQATSSMDSLVRAPQDRALGQDCPSHRNTDSLVRAPQDRALGQDCPSHRNTDSPVRAPDTLGLDRTVQATPSETFTPDSGYNLSASETSPYGVVAILAEQGLSVPEIARQTGYAHGEVELILSLTRRNTEENG
ncbi:MAG: hypothetical protein NZ843_01585 [Fimbriimonadales bacterium]|nr:hypothetical protein [Fimbriimonadales bacterium]